LRWSRSVLAAVPASTPAPPNDSGSRADALSRAPLPRPSNADRVRRCSAPLFRSRRGKRSASRAGLGWAECRRRFSAAPRAIPSRQPVMGVEQAEVLRFGALQGHRAVGNPDAFMIEIHHPGSHWQAVSSGRVPGKSGRWSKAICIFPAWLGMGQEEAGILVVHVDEIDALIRIKVASPVASSETSPPIGPGRSVGLGRKCRVGHHVALSGSTNVTRGSRSHR